MKWRISSEGFLENCMRDGAEAIRFTLIPRSRGAIVAQRTTHPFSSSSSSSRVVVAVEVVVVEFFGGADITLHDILVKRE